MDVISQIQRPSLLILDCRIFVAWSSCHQGDCRYRRKQ